jgi:hypothetical protein
MKSSIAAGMGSGVRLVAPVVRMPPGSLRRAEKRKEGGAVGAALADAIALPHLQLPPGDVDADLPGKDHFKPN